MHAPRLIDYPSAMLPPAMSLLALVTVLVVLAVHGTAPQADEGAAAHLWQLLMAGQIPLVAYFALRWLPHTPRWGASVLALQLGAALAAMAPVAMLHW